jgi:hypothetical protein
VARAVLSKCKTVIVVGGASLLCAGLVGCALEPEAQIDVDALVGSAAHGCNDPRNFLPNNLPMKNPGGLAASFKPGAKGIDLTHDFFTPQGTNGRSCLTCHHPDDGWGITPATAEYLFNCSDGLHPLFAARDSNKRFESDLSTVEKRRENFSMVLQGKFVRRRAMPTGEHVEFECISADDPFGVGSCNLIVRFRKALPTANFRTNGGFNWHVANTLESQVIGNITGAQEGPAPSPELVASIVDFERDLTVAQLIVPGVGRLDADGGRGGPEIHAQELIESGGVIEAGPFDLYDAWIDHPNPRKAQIARGQQLFNDGDQNGRRCGGCHNSKNNGNNVAGAVFDVGAADEDVAHDDMAIYCFRRLSDGEERCVSDPGRGIRTGKWTDIGRFKTPTLRGIAARAPYFHAGTSATLADVIKHYEVKLGFDFTDEEEADLVAFLNAL